MFDTNVKRQDTRVILCILLTQGESDKNVAKMVTAIELRQKITKKETVLYCYPSKLICEFFA